MNHNKGWHHSEETKQKMSQAQLGEKSNNWKGGISIDAHGYRRVTLSPDSPYFPMAHKCTSRKRNRDITEHRFIMAKHLGRCLYPFEIVHHKNGDKLDNRIENLKLLSQMKDHSPSMNYERWVEQIKAETKREVLEGLKKEGSTLEVDGNAVTFTIPDNKGKNGFLVFIEE